MSKKNALQYLMIQHCQTKTQTKTKPQKQIPENLQKLLNNHVIYMHLKYLETNKWKNEAIYLEKNK